MGNGDGVNKSGEVIEKEVTAWVESVAGKQAVILLVRRMSVALLAGPGISAELATQLEERALKDYRAAALLCIEGAETRPELWSARGIAARAAARECVMVGRDEIIGIVQGLYKLGPEVILHWSSDEIKTATAALLKTKSAGGSLTSLVTSARPEIEK